MPHAREQVRDAIVTVVTGLTTTGTNVFDSKVYPYEDADLPGLSVFTLKEQIARDDDLETIGFQQVRLLEVLIEARTKKVADMDGELDTICAEVEVAIMADVTLGGILRYIEIVETDIELSGEQEKPLGVARMLFNASYRTNAQNPAGALPG